MITNWTYYVTCSSLRIARLNSFGSPPNMSGSAAKDCGPSPANMNRAPRTVRIILRLIGFPPFGLGDAEVPRQRHERPQGQLYSLETPLRRPAAGHLCLIFRVPSAWGPCAPVWH